MLQIATGRFFRPGVELNERLHRRTLYTNTWFPNPEPVDLPVGTLIGSTDLAHVSTVTLEAVDRLEATTWEGTDEFLVATNGDELIDDIAYVMTFVLNRTFSRNHDKVHRLVPTNEHDRRRHSAAALFPGLFEPRQVVEASEWATLQQFMIDLISLHREDFARVMRAIRSTVDATRRALDDPTGAYTDFVAALESLSDGQSATAIPWERYNPMKRQIIDAALEDVKAETAAKLRAAILEADHAGLKSRFIASTLARVSPSYYRDEAIGTVRPPGATDLERMLSVAYEIRSRRTHVLQDLGDEAWVYTDGAETVFEGTHQQVLTLAGLWRLTRHAVGRVVADADKPPPEPWDYRGALPGQISAQLAPQYWIGQTAGFDAASAARRFDGIAEALISWLSDETTDGFNLTGVINKIEQLVPHAPDGEAKTAMVAIHVLWHELVDVEDHGPGAREFLDRYAPILESPSPHAFAVGVLSNHRVPEWSPDEWASMATARHDARHNGTASPLPARIDALIQIKAAEQLETAGRHDDAVVFAANAAEASPGSPDVMEWERRLLGGDDDPHFDARQFLFGKGYEGERNATGAGKAEDSNVGG